MWCHVICLDVRVCLFSTNVTRIIRVDKTNTWDFVIFGPSGGVVRYTLSESPGTPVYIILKTLSGFFRRAILETRVLTWEYCRVRWCSFILPVLLAVLFVQYCPYCEWVYTRSISDSVRLYCLLNSEFFGVAVIWEEDAIILLAPDSSWGSSSFVYSSSRRNMCRSATACQSDSEYTYRWNMSSIWH